MVMQRGKQIPTEPRFDFVTKKAYDFLLECGYSRFPISPFEVLNDLSDIVACLPWSEARSVFRTDDPFHLRQVEAEARTIRRRDNGLYMIVYDDVIVNSIDRISWTIMHEIGHIILGHLLDFDETALNRGGLTKQEYRVLEIEAHYFASEFLMPTALLKHFRSISVDEISLLFGVSEHAAQKKYKRVFKTTYLPNSIYEFKLIRNFYDFLNSGIDDALYKGIYRLWGMPWKTKYISICRKCPECHTYITDKEARYCTYCGTEIEPKKEYENLIARYSKQQKFNMIPGNSHPSLPKTTVSLSNGSKIERLLFCPICFNHSSSEAAQFCIICGQPIYNYCSKENNPLHLDELYCPSCGAKGTMHDSYIASEKRLKKIFDCSSQPQFSREWVEYPYWAFAKMLMCSSKSSVDMTLQTVLAYTKAYMNDDDDIIIYTDTVNAAATIMRNKDVVLEYIEHSDKIKHSGMEVYIIQ